ncbi:MAG: hypothetical protein RQ715_10790 [Methylococcales bacterium]|nr:hypothetical protein [Methylococcales bacterium]
MSFLALDRLAALDETAFRQTLPYPWLSLDGLLSAQGFDRLYQDLPPLSQLKRAFNRPRRYRQMPHDRYVLEYCDDLPLAPSWRAFIEQLKSPAYHAAIARLLGRDDFKLHCHWHYATKGCSVSPHCDARWKLGSQIFYFNREPDWQAEWGGETWVLDDRGRFPFNSAPAFNDFDAEYSAPAMGDSSLIFMRQGNSWHGVKPLTCPEGALRKVFIVEFIDAKPFVRSREFINYLLLKLT